MMPGQGWGNPVVGAVALRRPAIQSPNFVHNSTGWAINVDGSAEFQNATIKGTITAGTFNGTDFILNANGLFLYSGTPAAGNLIASITSTAGVPDPFGNGGLEGFTHYDSLGGNFLATSIQSAGLEWFRAASLAGPWTATAKLTIPFTGSTNIISTVSGVQAAGTFISSINSLGSVFTGNLTTDTTNRVQIDSNGKIQWGPGGSTAVDTDLYRSGADTLTTDGAFDVGNGLTVTAAGASVTGGTTTDTLTATGNATLESYVLLPTVKAAPAAPATGLTLWCNTNDRLAVIPAAGNSANVSETYGTQQGGNTNNTTSLNSLTNSYAIDANDAVAGTVYRLTCGGHGTQATGSPANLTFQLFAFGVAWGNSVDNGGVTAGSGFHWRFQGDLIIGTPSVSGPASFFGTMVISQASASAVGHSTAMDTQTTNTNTVASTTIAFQAGWSTTTGSPTIVCTGALLERLGSLCRQVINVMCR